MVTSVQGRGNTCGLRSNVAPSRRVVSNLRVRGGESIKCWHRVSFTAGPGVVASEASRSGVLVRHAGVRGVGDLLEELVILQHALQLSGEDKTVARNPVNQTWERPVSRRSPTHRQVLDSFRESSNLPHGALGVVHLQGRHSCGNRHRGHSP